MSTRINRPPQGTIALTALALLTEQPLHPYEMQRLMHDRRKDYAEGKMRALYRAIEELEAAGWIEPAETTREGRRPERTVYRITPEGHEALEDWLQDVLERPAREHLVFTAGVGLLAYLPLDRALDALQHRAVELRAELAARAEASAALTQEMHLPRVVLLEDEHERALREAELRWVLSLVEDMRAGRLTWDEESLRAQFELMHDHEMARRRHHRGPVPEPEQS
ncbi:MAG: PadR family transcriptional regulator [Candidatus Dormibacteria bacterium]|jgi:DNA-binding PadR family transcriptional regulator